MYVMCLTFIYPGYSLSVFPYFEQALGITCFYFAEFTEHLYFFLSGGYDEKRAYLRNDSFTLTLLL